MFGQTTRCVWYNNTNQPTTFFIWSSIRTKKRGEKTGDSNWMQNWVICKKHATATTAARSRFFSFIFFSIFQLEELFIFHKYILKTLLIHHGTHMLKTVTVKVEVQVGNKCCLECWTLFVLCQTLVAEEACCISQLIN